LWILAGVVLFTLAYGAVIGVKLQQERQAFISEAESSEARAAAFLSERVNGRLNEARAALAYAASDLGSMPVDAIPRRARERLQRLAASERIDGVAILLPGGEIVQRGQGPADWRAAADRALDAPGGLAPLLVEGQPPALILATPAPLADGRVGAFLARLPADALLPEWGENRIVALADGEGHALAMHPSMQGVVGGPPIATRLGVEQARIDALAEGGGGAMSETGSDDGSVTLAVAPVAGAELSVYSLTARRINQQAWINTLIFYGLLFVAPLFVALGLSFLALSQLSRLRKARQALVESEKRLRVAIEGARCGVWDWDPANDRMIVTAGLARMLGLHEATICNVKQFVTLLSRPDRERMQAALRGAPTRGEIDLEVLAAAAPLWLQMRGRMSTDASGQARIVGVAIDITERKGAQARVTAAENRLRAALESMSESFVLWDSKRRLVLWNRKFRDLFGLSQDMLRPGMPYDEVEVSAGSAIKAVHAETQDAETYELELADGRWLHYSERTTADGGLVSVGADITDLKRQGEELRDRESRLRTTVDDLKRTQSRIAELAKSYEEEKINAEQANRTKSEFLANMSHELRTPLNAINGFSEIMLREMFGPIGDERYVGYMNDIHASGEHLLALINDILDMSKIEAGKMELSPEEVRPADIVEQCLRIVRGRAEEKRLILRADVDDLPEIEADPRALKQVVINLLSNAVKFTPEGGRVTVRGFLSGLGVAFQVTDTGIGIAAEDLPRLGRPFEQIESQHSKSHQGSGLGLALSKSLIELHGGTLSIDSKLGEGTTLTFVLPISQDKSLGDNAAELAAQEGELDGEMSLETAAALLAVEG
jgi:two-component system cell cycle sensor histidine kinase PleC